MDQNIILAQRILKYAFGLSLILIGIDKVFHTNIVTNWESYVSPLALSTLPVSAVTLVSVLGIAEILIGILFFTGISRIAAYAAILAFVAIIANLISLRLYDIALRDALIALSSFVYILLTGAINNREHVKA